jgi:ABC-type cobalamin/Fe3+-siderophores transport system ATPase subunit
MKLEVKDLSFSYGENLVFEHVSFSAEGGDVLSLLGSNGTGKTTLFKVMLALYHRDEGEVFLDGQSISGWSRSEIAHYVGYVPQHHSPPFPFRVTDVVLMGRTAHLRAHHAPTKKDYDIALASMEMLNIEHLKDRIYTEISGGERQLVLIARALTQEPQILIMDEPTASLDFGNQIKMLRHINQLAQSGLTIIMSTHYPDHALQYSTKVALMKNHTIDKIGLPHEIITEENMAKLYGIGTKIIHTNLPENRRVSMCVAIT